MVEVLVVVVDDVRLCDVVEVVIDVFEVVELEEDFGEVVVAAAVEDVVEFCVNVGVEDVFEVVDAVMGLVEVVEEVANVFVVVVVEDLVAVVNGFEVTEEVGFATLEVEVVAEVEGDGSEALYTLIAQPPPHVCVCSPAQAMLQDESVDWRLVVSYVFPQ